MSDMQNQAANQNQREPVRLNNFIGGSWVDKPIKNGTGAESGNR